MRAAVWTIACVALVGACSLVTTVPNLTGGLDTAGAAGEAGPHLDATSPLDGGPTAEGGSTTDTGATIADAGSPEGGPSGDSSSVVNDASAGDAAPIDCDELDDDAGLFVCETFEHGLGFWITTGQGPGSTIGVDTSMAHRGTHSLHAHVDPSANEAGADAGQVAPMLKYDGALSSPALYARVFVYQPAPAPDNYDVFLFFNMSMTPYGGTGLGIDSNSSLKMQDWYAQPKAVETSSQLVPLGQWVCVTWQVFPNTTVSHTNVSNALVTDIDTTGLSVPDLTQTFVGLLSLVPIAAPIDLWLDDVVIADFPILCSE